MDAHPRGGGAGALLLAALAIGGCGEPSRRELRAEVMAGRHATAERGLNERYDQHLPGEFGHEREDADGRHALLWRMERGMVDYAQGEYQNALAHFMAATRLGRELRTASVSRGAATWVVNDTLSRYAGEPFEHAFVAYYGMLCCLALAEQGSGQWTPPPRPTPEDAKGARREPPPLWPAEHWADRAASAGAAIQEQLRAVAESEYGETAWRAHGWLHLAAAAARAATARDGDDRAAAALAAERAWKAWGEGKRAPPAVAASLVPWIVAQADPERARAIGGTPPPPGQGLVLVLEDLGYVPKREEQGFYAASIASARGAAVDIGGVFVWTDGPMDADMRRTLTGVPVPGSLVRALTGGSAGIFGFELPVLPMPRTRPQAGAVLGAPLEAVDDLAAHARDCFDDRKAARLVKTLTRIASKLVGTRQALGAISVDGRHSTEARLVRDVLWAISSGLLTATEQADARCWTMLPDRIGAALVALPPGEHRLSLRDADGRVRDLGTVRLAADRLVVLPLRSFPAGTVLGAED